MVKSTLNLIVLRTADLESALRFYQTLGLDFVQEQHGKGPVHYSCELNGLVIEIYPGKPGTAPDRKNAGAVMLGFQIEGLDTVIETLRSNGAVILTEPQDSEWGRRAVVQDVDGRAIELSQV